MRYFSFCESASIQTGFWPHSPVFGRFRFSNGKPYERNAEGIHRLLGTIRTFLDRLVQYVIVRPSQATANNLLCEQR